MFPTRVKVRISHALSYPATAKEISEALADVPQACVLTISFFDHYRRMKDRGRPYRVLEVWYGHKPGPSLERQWEIQVRPVPRNLRHAVNSLLKQQAFPAMRQWLLERKDLSSSHGIQSLTAIFSEQDATLRLERFQTGGEAFSI